MDVDVSGDRIPEIRSLDHAEGPGAPEQSIVALVVVAKMALWSFT